MVYSRRYQHTILDEDLPRSRMRTCDQVMNNLRRFKFSYLLKSGGLLPHVMLLSLTSLGSLDNLLHTFFIYIQTLNSVAPVYYEVCNFG